MCMLYVNIFVVDGERELCAVKREGIRRGRRNTHKVSRPQYGQTRDLLWSAVKCN